MNWLLNPSRMSVHSERIIVWHVYATTVSSTHSYTLSLFPMPSSSCLQHPNHTVLSESLCVCARTLPAPANAVLKLLSDSANAALKLVLNVS